MWILPSKGRPDACRRTMTLMRNLGAKGDILVCVNADDPRLSEYLDMRVVGQSSFLMCPPGTVGSAGALRMAFDQYPDKPWYGLMSDDSIPEAAGFEGRLIRAAGDFCFASTDDGWQAKADPMKGRMHGAVIFGGDLVRAVGYISPPGFKHLYIDDVWEVLGRELGNWRILMDIMVRHDHPFKDGSTPDETHAAVNSNAIADYDAAVFHQWRAQEFPAIVHRVRMAMWARGGLSLDNLSGKSVMFGLPCYDKVDPKREAALMDAVYLLAQFGVRVGHCHITGQTIHQARNGIADAFMRSDFTDLFFIDADMSFSSWDVLKFIAAPHPLLAGVGRKRVDKPVTDPDVWCFSPKPELDWAMPIDEYGMCEVAQVGTGFMRIRREVFEAILANDNSLLRAKDRERKNFYAKYFAWTDDGEDEISEDITFCRRYTEAGGKVWIDPTVTLRHYGNHEWSGCVRDIME